MVDIQSATAENRRGKKEKPQLQNIMSASAAQGGHNKLNCAQRDGRPWSIGDAVC